MAQIYLVARREFLAYVAAWGFWVSLFTAPILLAAVLFGPILLQRAEPSRFIVVLSDRPADAAAATRTFDDDARRGARASLKTYLDAAAPNASDAALAAFNSAPDSNAAIQAARVVVQSQAAHALRAFPKSNPRYVVAPSPIRNIEGLKPYLSGARAINYNGVAHPLYGAINIRRDAATGAPRIEYWSTNLSQREPADIAAEGVRLVMRREALAARGLEPSEADALDTLRPDIAQFDPRPSAAGGKVTLRQRAPFYAALLLTFVLWSVVFSVANMLLSGVIEEKSNKILDSLLTSVSPLQLLIGKLLGVAAVSATLLGLWTALGSGLLHVAIANGGQGVIGQIAAAFLDPRLSTAFAIGFVEGYLIYGAIFLALGSLCESNQEAQTLLGPVALVLALPLMLIAPALDNPNSPLIANASWFPLFTPFLMLVRAPSGLSWAEMAGQSATMIVCLVLVLTIAARVFHAGVVNQASAATLFGKKR